MLRFHHFRGPASASTLLLLLTLSAQADVQYTMQTSILQEGTLKSVSTVTTYLKDGLERTDSLTQIASFRAEEHTISSRAQHETMTIDPNLKIYVSEPLVLSSASGVAKASQINADGMNSKPGVGQMVLTVGAQFLGSAKMLGLPVRHYKTSTDIVSTGCCGAGHSNVKSEIWMADVKLPSLQASGTAVDWKSAFSQGKSNCKISFERKGDVAKYEEAQKGLALKTIAFDGNGNPISQIEVTKLSQAPLPASTFQASATFKKVTRAEYNRMRQGAMIAAMTSHGSAVGADDNN